MRVKESVGELRCAFLDAYKLAAERRYLRSPVREHWGHESILKNDKPRSGDISVEKLSPIRCPVIRSESSARKKTTLSSLQACCRCEIDDVAAPRLALVFYEIVPSQR